MINDLTEKTAARMWFKTHLYHYFSLMLNFLLLCFAHCQSLWVKNLGNIKGHLDREASVVRNCHLFQSCAVGQKNLEISILGFTEEREHIQG